MKASGKINVIQSKTNIDSDRQPKKKNFRYPHKTHLEPALDQPIQERPIIRQITIDLRPILGQVIDDCEVDNEDTPEVLKQVNKRSEAHTDIPSPLQRNSGAICISLPSVSICKSCETSRPSQTVQRAVSLVAVTDEGTLTCDPVQKSRNSSPAFFPKVILNQIPPQKTSKEQRPLSKINASWQGVEKLQLPMSELVRLVKERTDSGHHTLIARVLCSLREKEEKPIHQGAQDVRLLGSMQEETSHKTPYITCAVGGTRLTWMKRR
ncbi:uncharacterized protein [Aquarana catesbeiana]|uniref:uncharacterized protein n=1 Tax=Aquarana catesbeiana TaxID=8400 RepID=UPI003CC983D9